MRVFGRKENERFETRQNESRDDNGDFEVGRTRSVHLYLCQIDIQTSKWTNDRISIETRKSRFRMWRQNQRNRMKYQKNTFTKMRLWLQILKPESDFELKIDCQKPA